ncbi:MAG: DUF4416 family protein [Candidatus Omnitrophica bacterium]|nr:DUF4416 family protein [Candidatus Omnitrophota bacterium]
MGKIVSPNPVKLVIGLIFKDEEFLKKAEGILRRHFGSTDYASPVIPFSYTDYYREEFGVGLKRKFLCFTKLVPSERLAAIKVLTNKIETKLSQKNSRKINIDPGYLTMAKLVLASTKDYSHRIYLDKGIFAEVTLVYQKNSFQPREWTYPDYRTPEYIRIFLEIRKLYAQQINQYNLRGCI